MDSITQKAASAVSDNFADVCDFHFDTANDFFRKLGHRLVTPLPLEPGKRDFIDRIDPLLRLSCCKNNKSVHGLLNFRT